MDLTFRSLVEDQPGQAWRRVFNHGWPGWREWFCARSDGAPDLADARRALRRHLPEFETLWDELLLACGADDEAARFLSFWSPPRYLVNCSQAVLVDQDGPFLIRNYDLDPALNEATLLTTNWRGRKVTGMVEGMAGLSDGMNDAGLAISLTFGGRVVVGPGFGIPLILRYVLQTCADVPEALEALRAVPCHMSYNVTLVDRHGAWATVYLSPDRPAIVKDQPWTTNHQLGVEWPGHGRISRTLERAEHLTELFDTEAPAAADLAAEFARTPLFSTNYAQGFGTVYTAAYRPAAGTVRLSWRDGTSCWQDMAAPEHWEQTISYADGGSGAAHGAWTTPARPDWYSTFLGSHPQPEDEADLARQAAFWRRNHLGQDHDWSNLTPPKEIKIEEE